MIQLLRWSINLVALLFAASLSYADATTLCGLSDEETLVLRQCIDKGDVCRQYWPSQQADLKDCGRTKQWVGWAMSAPTFVKEKMFGSAPALSKEAPSSPTESAPTTQASAWKNLPRRSDSLAPKGAPTIATNTQNPYGGTSDKIETGAARAAAVDFWVGSLNRIATVTEQIQSENNVDGRKPTTNLAPGNASHCLTFHDAPNGRSHTIENSCPFIIQTYRCASSGSLGLECISTMPIRSSYHDNSHYIGFSYNGTTFLYGACKGRCNPGGSFFIEDGISPDCECKPSTGSVGSAK